jgi:O-methyltransferase
VFFLQRVGTGTEKAMSRFINTVVRPVVRTFGVEVVRYRPDDARGRDYPPDFSASSRRICDAVRPFTMTSAERVNALVEAVRYIVTSRIEGAIVECGVWKGGSAMAAALMLEELGDRSRDVHLYDTFAGMTAPGEVDVSCGGVKASVQFAQRKIAEDASGWCRSGLDEVRANVFSTGYPREKFHFIEGKVEETIPAHIPGAIALLRLDTDWYESTKHELVHLFPRLTSGGVLIIDDYGHWEGARKAVDEYIAEHAPGIFLSRIDYTGRLAIKMP